MAPARDELWRRCAARAPDLLCAAEGDLGFADLPHRIEGGPDWGYGVPAAAAGRRKIALWSRWPWREADALGDTGLPPGRFVAGRCETPLGDLSVCGVCVPWSHAHVATGRRDRAPWEDHVAYLARLPSALAALAPDILLGDFNQTVPRRRAPAAAPRPPRATPWRRRRRGTFASRRAWARPS